MLRICKKSGKYKENKGNNSGWDSEMLGKLYKYSSERSNKSGDIAKESSNAISRDNKDRRLNKRCLSNSCSQLYYAWHDT